MNGILWMMIIKYSKAKETQVVQFRERIDELEKQVTRLNEKMSKKTRTVS